jgi:small-conductance mechanosensitive channel
VCLPAAITLGFFIRPIAALSFLPLYFATGADAFEGMGFFGVLWQITGFTVGEFTISAVFPLILILVVCFLTFCVAFSVIERHLRSGKLTLKKPLSKINDYFIPTLKVILVLGGILVLYFALVISLSTVQHVLISGAGNPPNIGSIITSVIISLVLFFVMCWIVSPLIFMVPLMQIYGYKFGVALKNAFSYYGNNAFKITVGLSLVLLIGAGLQAGLSALSVYLPNAVEILLATVLHLFMLVYLVAYCMVTTFVATGMERRDIKKKPWEK